MCKLAMEGALLGNRLMWTAVRIISLVVAILIPAAQPSRAEALKATDFKIAGNAERVRLVMQLDGEPEIHWVLVRGPYRFVVEMPATRFAFDPHDVSPRGLVKSVQYGAARDGSARLILSTNGPFLIEKVDLLKNEDGHGYRFVADLAAASDREFEAALADQAIATGAVASKASRVGPSVDRPAKPFTIVVDAGHGGLDGGANGITGAVEKDITLAFALELKRALSITGKYNVILTRDTDIFLRLDERVAIARQADADLFISIHADTINVKGLRGATVYTVSDQASDAESQALADRENMADKLAGIDIPDENRQVADILVDLIRRETHAFSIRFARTLVDELSSNVGLIKQPHRSAGFRVLKAPDVPSVLVELGYLSNVKDEAQLTSEDWRAMAARCIANAVASFAEAKAARG